MALVTTPPLHRRLSVSVGAALLVVIDVATLGFVTLGFEMVASRILTPLFGSGIYTWANDHLDRRRRADGGLLPRRLLPTASRASGSRR